MSITLVCKTCSSPFPIGTRNPKTAKYCSIRCLGLSLSSGIEDRFWRKVDKTGGNDACWPWTAGKFSNGYGQVKWQGKTYTAHRLSWILTYGEIDEGMFVCHKCDFKLCANPSHLFLGTPKENSEDRDKKGRTNPPAGEMSGTAKLTESDIRAIRSDPRKNKVIAHQYGITHGHVGQIKLRKAWRHVH